MAQERFLLRTAFCLSGPLLWTAQFGLVYGVQHAVCARFPGLAITMPGFVVIASVIFLAACASVAMLAARVLSPGFYRTTTWLLLGLSAYAITASLLAGAMLPGCPVLR